MTSRVLPIGIIFDFCIPIGGHPHHREDLYPDSKQFRPERFLERQFSPTEFVPMKEIKREKSGHSEKNALVEVVDLH
ncbi:hypothetical protein PN471_04970 [Aphanizomenon sp. CS-733/32]|uniref:hypothetical protein n=1 Tax=Aphanizomenon sp. CS-733/32 TaxID=3021715 RepID=UPI0023313496|nr:hypothetical protein [Aphanizomenon sp. CS-733/32]MDB9308003.1 hypothetical protein [Aphanizomenon sp. CS-733/32]